MTKISCLDLTPISKHELSAVASKLPRRGPKRRIESMNEMRRSQIAQAILDYLFEHPGAQDTLAGIAEWWLPEEKKVIRLAIVKEALDQLVAKALVLERKGKDLQIHYRINSQRLKEIERLVR